MAVKTGAMRPEDTRRVIVDTTVQPKNIMFPTDAKLLNRARERLVALAKKSGLDLRQSYVRVGKFALIRHQRYAHAKQFSAPTRHCARSRPISAAPSATSPPDRGRGRAAGHLPQAPHLAARVLEQRQNQRGKRSIACMRRRSNASARKSPCALRVRREGLDRHHAAPLERRAVRAACHGAARKPL